MRKISVICTTLVLFLNCACEEKEKKGKASIAFNGSGTTLALNHQDTTARREAPTVLGVKLIAVYLSEGMNDDGSNAGKTGIVYLNPECQNDIKSCDVGGSTYTISSFFNLARAPDLVNAEINAQAQEIDSGTYYYARIEFCKTPPSDAKNLRFKTSGMSEPAEILRASCTASSARSPTGIVIDEGTTVTVDLGYTYADAALILSPQDSSTGGNRDCVTVGDHRECVIMPTFTPSGRTL